MKILKVIEKMTKERKMSRMNCLVLMIIVLLSTVTVGCAEKGQGPS